MKNWNALIRFSNVLELNVELSTELNSEDNLFRLCKAEEEIRNLENVINKTLDLITPKKIITNKKDKTGLPTKLKMLVPKNNVFGIIFGSPGHKKFKKIQLTEKQNENNGKKTPRRTTTTKFLINKMFPMAKVFIGIWIKFAIRIKKIRNHKHNWLRNTQYFLCEYWTLTCKERLRYHLMGIWQIGLLILLF